MSPIAILIIYCVLIVAASLMGGRLSTILKMTHLRTQLLLSGVGGLMLGIALLHLMPHAGSVLGSYAQVGAGTLIGLTIMFLLIRLFHTHDHTEIESDHEHTCDHPHHHNDEHGKGISWAGLLFGLGLHTVVDGVALASSVMADHGSIAGLAGIGTFLAVWLHKPLDAFAITSVMKKQGWSRNAQNLVNAGFSLACPIGALAFYFGATQFGGQAFLGWGLAVSAGFFIGIALGDLLPEVAFHDHDRDKLTAVFLLGIAIAVVIENLPGHDHAARTPTQPSVHQKSQIPLDSSVPDGQ